MEQVNQAENSPLEQHPIKNQRGKFPIILGVLILLLVIGGTAYFLGVSKKQAKNVTVTTSPTLTESPLQQKTVSIEPSEIANWQTFDAKDFSFKYPTNSDIKYGFAIDVLNNEEAYGYYIQPNIKDAQIPEWHSAEFFTIKNIPQSSTSEYLNTLSDYDKDTLTYYKNGTIEGYSFTIKQNTYPYLTVIQVKNHNLYVFRVSGRRGIELTEYSQNMLHKILSTLAIKDNPTPDPTITDLIQVTLPQEWTQKVTDTDKPGYAGRLSIISPDLANSCCGGSKTNAVVISFDVTYDGKFQTADKKYKEIYDEIHGPNPGGAVSHDLTRTTVAGYPAISSYYDFEGHSHTYYVWNEDYLWQIEIAAPSEIQEEQHKNEINSILSSIQFTQPASLRR